jgi:hypothetical protein
MITVPNHTDIFFTDLASKQTSKPHEISSHQYAAFQMYMKLNMHFSKIRRIGAKPISVLLYISQGTFVFGTENTT